MSTDCGHPAPLFRVDIDQQKVRSHDRRRSVVVAWTPLRSASAGSWPCVSTRSTAHLGQCTSIQRPPRSTGRCLPCRRRAQHLPPPGSVETDAASAGDGAIVGSWLILPGAPAPRILPPSCSGWTAVRWARGTPGPGAGTPGYWRHGAGRFSSPTRRCRQARPGHDQKGLGPMGRRPLRRPHGRHRWRTRAARLDSSRTAAMGGSYGGYMANWIAGQTQRFRAIVGRASVWSLGQFGGTTDSPADWADELGWPDTNTELYKKWSPDHYVDQSAPRCCSSTANMLPLPGERIAPAMEGSGSPQCAVTVLVVLGGEPLDPAARRHRSLIRDRAGLP